MTDLCCCEYWDYEGERNHIMACCCNCRDLDEGFEGLLSGKGITPQNKSGVSKAFRDRMRIPWLGGAKQITPDIAFPVILIPSLIFFGAINLQCTIIASSVLFTAIVIIYKYFLENMPKFFFMCTVTSIVTIYVIFQFIVVSFLLILLEENVGASVALLVFIVCMFKTKTEANRLRESVLNSEKLTEKIQYCLFCEIYTPEGSQHRFWIDSCIIPKSMKYYITGLVSVLATLLYSSNLTLTSVCHPFNVYMNILLPDDCSEVYNMIELALSFVSALYSILLSAFVFWELLSSLKLCMCGMRKGNQRSCYRSTVFNCFRNICCFVKQCKYCNAQ